MNVAGAEVLSFIVRDAYRRKNPYMVLMSNWVPEYVVEDMHEWTPHKERNFIEYHTDQHGARPIGECALHSLVRYQKQDTPRQTDPILAVISVDTEAGSQLLGFAVGPPFLEEVAATLIANWRH